jgi:hypothetical protein
VANKTETTAPVMQLYLPPYPMIAIVPDLPSDLRASLESLRLATGYFLVIVHRTEKDNLVTSYQCYDYGEADHTLTEVRFISPWIRSPISHALDGLNSLLI